jgi:hypothetical protein
MVICVGITFLIQHGDQQYREDGRYPRVLKPVDPKPSKEKEVEKEKSQDEQETHQSDEDSSIDASQKDDPDYEEPVNDDEEDDDDDSEDEFTKRTEMLLRKRKDKTKNLRKEIEEKKKKEKATEIDESDEEDEPLKEIDDKKLTKSERKEYEMYYSFQEHGGYITCTLEQMKQFERDHDAIIKWGEQHCKTVVIKKSYLHVSHSVEDDGLTPVERSFYVMYFRYHKHECHIHCTLKQLKELDAKHDEIMKWARKYCKVGKDEYDTHDSFMERMEEQEEKRKRDEEDENSHSSQETSDEEEKEEERPKKKKKSQDGQITKFAEKMYGLDSFTVSPLSVFLNVQRLLCEIKSSEFDDDLYLYAFGDPVAGMMYVDLVVDYGWYGGSIDAVMQIRKHEKLCISNPSDESLIVRRYTSATVREYDILCKLLDCLKIKKRSIKLDCVVGGEGVTYDFIRYTDVDLKTLERYLNIISCMNK